MSAIRASRWIAFSAVITRCAADGMASCPCVEWHNLNSYLDSGNNHLQVQISGGGVVYLYPPTYGNVLCQAWDQNLPPYCVNPDGSPKAFPPSWCYQSWCYVDSAACSVRYARSSYFPNEDLYYSYQTCGSQNSFAAFVQDGMLANPNSTIGELITLVEGYTRASTNGIEEEYAATGSTVQGSSGCTLTSGCNCLECDNKPGWGNELVDFSDIMALSHSQAFTCLGNIIKDTYIRNAQVEYDDQTRIGFQYAGHQADGSYMQWPALAWCPSNFGSPGVPGYDSGVYDPRFRDWYAAAASGPKDVVIVIDTSGSMRRQGRMSLAKTAAKRVLQTLTSADFVNVVNFSTDAGSFAERLVPATSSQKSCLNDYIDSLFAEGGTNFVAAFDQALRIFEESRGHACTSSGCNGALLFLSDGEPNDWGAAQLQAVRSRNSDGYIAFFTFGLSSGANMAHLQDLVAPPTRGFAQQVPDGGALGDAMSRYYLTFADSSNADMLRWVIYDDWITGTELLAGCMPMFDRRGLASNASGTLLGVTCMDINMVADLATLRQRHDFSGFEAQYSAHSRRCSNGVTLPGGPPNEENCNGWVCDVASSALGRSDLRHALLILVVLVISLVQDSETSWCTLHDS